MSQLNLETADGLQSIADRHGVSLDAVSHLLWALEAGNGTMAQFNHPDLGGFGQWSSGGMIMIGQMFDHGLKARVASLCSELAQGLPQGSGASTESGGWWPAGLGRPSSSGAQDGMRYAYFPESRRLAIEADGALSVYDTGDHDIGGVSQAQGGGRSLRFTGRNGAVDLGQLKRVDGASLGSPPSSAPQPFHPEPIVAEAVSPAPASPAMPPASTGGDVLGTLEKLAGLRDKGILTDAEFSAKKAELLARL